MWKKLLKFVLFWFALGVVLPAIITGVVRYRAAQIPLHRVLKVVFDEPIEEFFQPNLKNLFLGEQGYDLQELLKGIRHAAGDPRIDGIFFHIRHPSLGLAQIDDVHQAMQAFHQSGKWSVSYFDTTMENGIADGIYALASSTQKIIMAPPGEIDLQGYQAEVSFYKETLQRLKITPYIEQRYEYKNMANSFSQTDFTPEHKEALKGVLDDIQNFWLHLVASARKTEPEIVKNWILQSPFDANGALQQHLIDESAYWDEVVGGIQDNLNDSTPFLDIERYLRHGIPDKHLGPKVAYITASGQIGLGESPGNMGAFNDGVSSDNFTDALRQARKDKVEAIVVRVDSPGGSYVASDLIRREIAISQQANIPVIISMAKVAASGGYLISMGASHIIASPATITGSIGVLMLMFPLREALQHFLGLHFSSYSTLPHPGQLSFLDNPTIEQKKILSHRIDTIYNAFVDTVAEARHQSHDAIHQVAKGHIWSGQQALQHGLIDGLGGIETSFNYVRHQLGLADDAALNITVYPKAEQPLQLLLKTLSRPSLLLQALQSVAWQTWSKTWQKQQAVMALPATELPIY